MCNYDNIKLALNSNGNSVRLIDDDFLDKELAIICVNSRPMAIRYLPKEYRSDFDVASKAIL